MGLARGGAPVEEHPHRGARGRAASPHRGEGVLLVGAEVTKEGLPPLFLRFLGQGQGRGPGLLAPTVGLGRKGPRAASFQHHLLGLPINTH